MVSFGIVLYQDIKERQVYWFLFPIIAISGALLFCFKTTIEMFMGSIFINLTLISLLIFIIFFYSKVKLGYPLNQVLGLGDILFFFAIALSFSSISFIILFVSSLIFSLLIHLLINKGQNVPLAGYMSLFFGITYLSLWLGLISSVYQI